MLRQCKSNGKGLLRVDYCNVWLERIHSAFYLHFTNVRPIHTLQKACLPEKLTSRLKNGWCVKKCAPPFTSSFWRLVCLAADTLWWHTVLVHTTNDCTQSQRRRRSISGNILVPNALSRKDLRSREEYLRDIKRLLLLLVATGNEGVLVCTACGRSTGVKPKQCACRYLNGRIVCLDFNGSKAFFLWQATYSGGLVPQQCIYPRET
jgi:hypothetical protein